MVPAFSWNSLIHQHSYKISCRKDIFIGCEKKRSGGSQIGAQMGGNQKHPFRGCFSFLFSYGRQILNRQLTGSTKIFVSSLIFPVEPSCLYSPFPLLFFGTPLICAFPSFFSVLFASQEADPPRPRLHWAVRSEQGSHFQPFLM